MKKMKLSPWPIGIAVYFFSFFVLVVIFAIKASGVRFDLVTKDYYAQELVYSDTMEARQRAMALEEKPAVRLHGHLLTVQPPAIWEAAPEATGRLHLYRASDARQDIRMEWNPGEPTHLTVQGKLSGWYQVRLYWEADGKSYFDEHDVYLEPGQS